jgi:hypothetical protein
VDELPLKNWRLFHESRDLRYFQRVFDKDQELTNEHLLCWFSIYDQLYIKYGHNPKYTKYLEKKKQYALKMTDYLSTGDIFKMNKVNITRIDMEGIISDSDGIEIKEGLIAIRKYMGFAQGINENTLSVGDYHDYLESMTAQYGKAS